MHARLDGGKRAAAQLTRAHIPHVFQLFPGGHSQQLWQARAPAWLRLALEHLAPAD